MILCCSSQSELIAALGCSITVIDLPDTRGCDVLARQAFNYVEKFGASLPTLPAAVTLCRLLSCLASKTDIQDELRLRTSENNYLYLQLASVAGC